MLHTVNKSPFEKNSLETCLRLAEDNSSILLIEDGVYGALKNTTIESSIINAQKTNKFHWFGFSQVKLYLLRQVKSNYLFCHLVHDPETNFKSYARFKNKNLAKVFDRV